MATNSDPEHDPSTLDDLVNAALTAMDEDATSEAVRELYHRATYEVLERARSLCESECPFERRIGARILRGSVWAENALQAECCSQLRRLLRAGEQPDVLDAVFASIGEQRDARAVPIVIGFASHPHPDVRLGVVHALSGQRSHLAVNCLISPTSDAVARVRDWATFAIGTLIDIDSPEIRNALATRLDDPDFDTRSKALIGLAERKDPRVVSALIKELSSDCIGTLAVEAAELIASNELLPLLVELRDWWDVDCGLLEQAIAACSWR